MSMASIEETIRTVFDAFNRHDVPAILEHFSEDAVFEASTGPDVCGRRFTGRAAIGDAFSALFRETPNAHYEPGNQWITDDSVISLWTFTGTNRQGQETRANGCDIWKFRQGKIVRKDAYRKIVQPDP
jgi:ketosteroid isomerase-like protein